MKVKLYGIKSYMKWMGEYYGTVGNNFYYDNSELLDKNNRFDINKNLYPKVYKNELYRRISDYKNVSLKTYDTPLITNVIVKPEKVFLKEIDVQKDVFENNREYAYGDYIFSYMPIYDFKDECYVLNVGCIENVQLNNKEDVIADFNYIVESINQLNDETKSEIEKIKSQYNCHHKNSISIFTKFKNLFKNK